VLGFLGNIRLFGQIRRKPEEHFYGTRRAALWHPSRRFIAPSLPLYSTILAAPDIPTCGHKILTFQPPKNLFQKSWKHPKNTPKMRKCNRLISKYQIPTKVHPNFYHIFTIFFASGL
jgi:hypothetical protein